jgi:hypothetical protein
MDKDRRQASNGTDKDDHTSRFAAPATAVSRQPKREFAVNQYGGFFIYV